MGGFVARSCPSLCGALAKGGTLAREHEDPVGSPRRPSDEGRESVDGIPAGDG